MKQSGKGPALPVNSAVRKPSMKKKEKSKQETILTKLSREMLPLALCLSPQIKLLSVLQCFNLALGPQQLGKETKKSYWHSLFLPVRSSSHTKENSLPYNMSLYWSSACVCMQLQMFDLGSLTCGAPHIHPIVLTTGALWPEISV